MEPPKPIYLQSCGECGRPALTFDEQGDARCAEHAVAFIPADGAPSDDTDADERR